MALKLSCISMNLFPTLLLVAMIISVSASCNDQQFQCKASKRCIPSQYKCNGFADCPDNSDEDGSVCGKGPSAVEFRHHVTDFTSYKEKADSLSEIVVTLMSTVQQTENSLKQVKSELSLMKSKQQGLQNKQRQLESSQKVLQEETYKVSFDVYRTSGFTTTGSYITYADYNTKVNADIKLHTGLFTCKKGGTYMFTFSATSDSTESLYADFYKNSNGVGRAWKTPTTSNNMVNGIVIVRMSYGDTFGIKLRVGALHDDSNKSTHFTGTRLSS